MKLLIGIATYKRLNKLTRLLHSLQDQTYQNFQIYIICDNKDYETAHYLETWGISNAVQDSHKFVIGAWNKCIQDKFINGNYDGFIGLVDDVQLRPNALEEIVKCHKENFPDTDGVCGFNQICYGYFEYTFKWYGQTLMGRKFIERYHNVNYQICCPDYKHFYQDEEMWIHALTLNKFQTCPKAVLNHDHPSFTGNIDETHNIIRKGNLSPKEHDIKVYAVRKLKKYCWGLDFNLIGKGNI